VALLLATGLALPSVAAARTLPGFRSPSGNIACLYVPAARDDTGHRLPAQLLCSIRSAAYAAALQERCLNPPGTPSHSGVDWHGWRLATTGRGSVVCSGGILYRGSDHPGYATLAYGRSWRRGVFACASRVSGVTCRSRSGHGVFVSREAWRAW